MDSTSDSILKIDLNDYISVMIDIPAREERKRICELNLHLEMMRNGSA